MKFRVFALIMMKIRSSELYFMAFDAKSSNKYNANNKQHTQKAEHTQNNKKNNTATTTQTHIKPNKKATPTKNSFRKCGMVELVWRVMIGIS